MNLLPLLTPELVDDYRTALIREAQRDRLAGLARGTDPAWGRLERTDRGRSAGDRRLHLVELWAALLGRRPAHR